jgi:hypothetical protein
MDGPHPFHDFMKSNAKISWHLVPLIPEVPNSKMSKTLDQGHVSQPRYGSDLFQGFHHGDSWSPVLRTSDIPISEVPISRRLSGLSLCLRGFKPRETPVRSHDWRASKWGPTVHDLLILNLWKQS